MSASNELQELLDRADEIETADSAEAIKLFRLVLSAEDSSEDAIRHKERAINHLGLLYVKTKQAGPLSELIRELHPFFNVIPKARTAKLVRFIIDQIGKIPGTADIQVSLCKETITWCEQEKRSFLRIRVQLRLAQLYLEQKHFQDALSIVNTVLSEVKRLDDKQLLVEIHLLESKIHLNLRNIPKARATLTAGRAAANSIYISPELQAEIDMQAGTLSAEESDYRTGTSYFFEAFEGLNALNDPSAVYAFKYMLLCKIMCGMADDVFLIVNGKHGLRYAGRHVESMRAFARAYTDRSLIAFERILKEFKPEIVDDPFISRHLGHLNELLLEQNLLGCIEPFSCVEISHIADLIGLDPSRIESKLSQLILDKKFVGTLEQDKGQLLVFERDTPDAMYTAAQSTITNMGDVVENLFKRAERLK